MTSVVLGTRPDWTRSTLGIPIDTVVKVHSGSAGAKPDIAFSRNRVSVSRVPGAAAKPEDEYDVGYVYGPDATNQDVAARSLMPLLRKFVDGYNVAVMAFGATGSGKTLLLEGSRGKERGSPEGGGLVHLALDELFKLLAEKAAAVAHAVAERRRGPTARAFDFFVESSFVELYREEVYDLYGTYDRRQQYGATAAAGQGQQPPAKVQVQVYEDPTEGYQCAGLASRPARSAVELRTHFNAGRTARDATREDVGPVHERASAVFTVHLAQYAPAVVAGEEDRVVVSKLQFVDLPGAERLAEDPEVLRLREGPTVNRQLHAFAATLRSLAEGPGGGLAAAAAANGGSGGGASFVGQPRPGSAAAWGGGGLGSGGGGPVGVGPMYVGVGSAMPLVNYEASALTKLLADALGGNSLCLLVGCLRQADGSSGLHALTTLQHLAIAHAGRNFPVINHGRSRGLMQKLRQRILLTLEDRQALRDVLDATPAEGDPNNMALTLAKLRDLEARLLAVRGENAELAEEKAALQARLDKLHQASEGEMDEKEELQEALIQSEEQRLQLARALIDFQMEYNEAKQEWEAARFELEAKLLEAEAKGLEAAVGAQEESSARISELENALRQIAGEEEGEDGAEEAEGDDDELVARAKATAARGRRALDKAKEQERRVAELSAELSEARRELQQLREGHVARMEEDEQSRSDYASKLAALKREVAEMGRAVALTASDPQTDLRVTPHELFDMFGQLAEQDAKVCTDREASMRAEVEDLRARHAELKGRFDALWAAYRELRYQVEDTWPTEEPPPPRVAPEEQVAGAAPQALASSDASADASTVAALRDQVAALAAENAALRVARAEEDARLGKPQPQPQAPQPAPAPEQAPPQRQRQQPPEVLPALELENQRLREELDRLRSKMAADPAAAAAKAASGSVPTAAANAATEGVIRQLREHGQKTAAELQRKYQSAESRATMAEEQLAQLQAYMAKASVSYQKEIVRLRAIVGQMEVSMGVKQGSYLNLNPLEGAGGGGALRPAAEVLDEHEQRGSAGSRQGQRGGGQGQGGGRQR